MRATFSRDARRLTCFGCEIAGACRDYPSHIRRRLCGSLNLAEQSRDGVDATFATGQRPEGLELARGCQARQNLRNQTSLQRQFLAIDGNARRETMSCFFFDGAGKNASYKTTKEVDRQFAPKPAIFCAIENLFSNQLQKRMRSGEVEERISLALGDKSSATLNQTRAIIAEEST